MKNWSFLTCYSTKHNNANSIFAISQTKTNKRLLCFSHFDNISFIITCVMTSGVFKEKKLLRHKTCCKSIEQILMEVGFNLVI